MHTHTQLKPNKEFVVIKQEFLGAQGQDNRPPLKGERTEFTI